MPIFFKGWKGRIGEIVISRTDISWPKFTACSVLYHSFLRCRARWCCFIRKVISHSLSFILGALSVSTFVPC
ncbi:hypothetical protein ARMGADRAFT_598501 [Armillaria gallica]|uniref:Uncharacterized protein n=1 Tax=Armillaria gallica TaxID=47427 RepID=A0A2H3DBN9_ARMGA|nr:hypothetical protein ARMGADRAFT_598501 [Armillaria gallica]